MVTIYSLALMFYIIHSTIPVQLHNNECGCGNILDQCPDFPKHAYTTVY